jgi:hypothetical protein
MDPVQAKLAELEKKIDALYASAEQTRKYFLWTGIITLAVILLPLLFLPFVISQLMSVYGDMGILLQ